MRTIARRAGLVTGFGALLILVTAGIALAFQEQARIGMPSNDQVLDEIRTQGFEIGVVSHEYERYAASGLPGTRANITLATVSQSDAQAVWFGQDALEAALDPGMKPVLTALMEEGKVLMFFGLQDVNRFSQLFGIRAPVVVGDESHFPDLVYAWLFRNHPSGKPKVTIGTVFLPGVTDQERIVREALLQSWKHKGHVNQNFPTWPNKDNRVHRVIPFLESVAKANADPGADWAIRYGPYEQNWSPAECSSCYHNEYYTGWALDPAVDQDGTYDYFAQEWWVEIVPAGGSTFPARSYQLKSDGDYGYQGQHHQLFDYGPQSDPSSSTISFNIGIGTGGAGFGISWTVSHNDLTFVNDSNVAIELFDGLFDYDWTSSYAQHTSNHNPGVTFQVDPAEIAGDGYAWLHDWRRTYWERFGPDIWVVQSFVWPVSPY